MESNSTVEAQKSRIDLSAFKPVEENYDESPTATEHDSTSEPQESDEAQAAESTSSEDVTQTTVKESTEVDAPAEESADPAEEPAVTDWRKVLKEQKPEEVIAELGDKKAILKALGISDFVIDLNDHYQNHGDVRKYLDVASRNYAEMSDDAVIREAIRSAHPNAPDKVIEKLVAKEIKDFEYDPEVDDEETKELNSYLKKEKADQYREKLIAEQQKFLIPEAQPVTESDDEKAKQMAETEAAQQKEVQALISKINEDPETRRILTEKKVLIGGDAKYQFAISDPDELRQMATGEKNFYSMFLREDGTFDMAKWYATAAFTKNQSDYENALINYGKTLALKEQIEADENPPSKEAVPAPAKRKSILDAFRS